MISGRHGAFRHARVAVITNIGAAHSVGATFRDHARVVGHDTAQILFLDEVARIARILGNFVEEQDLGRVMSNDSGVVTERGPDTVRGADICYYSYTRMPKGPMPTGYHSIAPELVLEVRSPRDRWPRILTKVGEYLDAGVLVVGVHDEHSETLTIYRPENVQQVLTLADDLTFPE